MEAAKNRFVKIDGSGDLLRPGKRHVRSLRVGVGSSITMHRVRMRFVKIDGSGDLLPDKRHVRFLRGRAGVGSSITTHGVRMKLGHKNNYSNSVKLATRLPGRDSDSYALAITEEVN